jgi:hypothetical protein
VYNDLSKIAPEHYIKKITARITDIKAVETPADRSAFIVVLESMYRFTLGSIAGAIGLFQNIFFKPNNIVCLSNRSHCCLPHRSRKDKNAKSTISNCWRTCVQKFD